MRLNEHDKGEGARALEVLLLLGVLNGASALVPLQQHRRGVLPRGGFLGRRHSRSRLSAAARSSPSRGSRGAATMLAGGGAPGVVDVVIVGCGLPGAPPQGW